MDVPEPVRRLALYPFRDLPRPPDVEHVEFDGAFIAINRWPTAQVVSMRAGGPSDVEATVEAARVVARERGKSIVVSLSGVSSAAVGEHGRRPGPGVRSLAIKSACRASEVVDSFEPRTLEEVARR